MNRKNKIIIHVITPIIIGGFIYILFREKNLLMFSWFISMGLDSLINNFRDIVIWHNQIPDWITYNLPDGIWIYSLTSLMIIIWYKDSNKSKYFWLLIGPILGITLELGQLINLFPGTFDNIDLLFYFCGSGLPFFIFNQNKQRMTK
jgi:hypothetical protein|tara:strand:+ start:126 stop:566 length:441 start_codon:yes stop_codon:yes gene_type:complete